MASRTSPGEACAKCDDAWTVLNLVGHCPSCVASKFFVPPEGLSESEEEGAWIACVDEMADSMGSRRVEEEEEDLPIAGPAPWLVLSVKWSASREVLRWWGPNRSGYTTLLEEAGRYTEAEAKAIESSLTNELQQGALAVPLSWAEQAASRVVRTSWPVLKLWGVRDTPCEVGA